MAELGSCTGKDLSKEWKARQGSELSTWSRRSERKTILRSRNNLCKGTGVGQGIVVLGKGTEREKGGEGAERSQS